MWMRSTCSAGTSIQVVFFTVFFHPGEMNCTQTTVNYEPFYSNCCRKNTTNLDRDCRVEHTFNPQYSVSIYQTCNGKPSCDLMVPQIITRTYHDQCPYSVCDSTPWDIVSNLMFMNYYCIDSKCLYATHFLIRHKIYTFICKNILLQMNYWLKNPLNGYVILWFQMRYMYSIALAPRRPNQAHRSCYRVQDLKVRKIAEYMFKESKPLPVYCLSLD